ncbi:DUF418 domain-containing protein [Hyalangium gracile]|uniref:DUF418 domain-containing protein n=1 Tax=Hyalangium gracile TaxID=394092 RepID=UPI001CCCED41|nr:DUF418 domain-containing protein [Hyalangium gracile]
MSVSLPADSVPAAPAQPLDSGERLVLLDALRGFALSGVFISNVYMWFSGLAFMSRPQIEALNREASVLDGVARFATMFLVFGKFITLFSFLFGLGFAVQMGRAEQRGTSIVPLYARRLGILVAIGLGHMFLIWFGDILTSYALMGFGLLLFRSRSDKTLLLWACVFIFLAPVVTGLVPQLLEPRGSAEALAAAAKEASERSAATKAQVLEAFTHGSYLDAVRVGAVGYVREFLKLHLLFLLPILGRFLLGLLAGRHRVFHDVVQHRPFFRKLLLWGFVAGAIGNGASILVTQLVSRKVLSPASLPWLPHVMSPVRTLGELGLAAVYAAAFALLFQRAFWRRVLSVLAPAGRMAMTNYLSQSVISVLIFYGYGLGLIGKARPALCVGLCLGIFTVQVLVSHLWLSRFRLGPAEWLWRSLTYGKAQPMRRDPGTAEIAV